MRALRWLCHIIFFLVPFIIERAHRLSPAELPKELDSVFLIVPLFLLFLFFWLRKSQIVLKWSPGLWLVGLVLMCNLVSYIFTSAPHLSFWGDRNLPSDSVLTVIVFTLLAMVFHHLIDPDKDYRLFATTALSVLAGQIIIGLVQKYDLYSHWYITSAVFGTFGVTIAYANFIGACMVFVYQFLYRCKNTWILIALYGLGALGFFMILSSNSRTPFVLSLLFYLLISSYEIYRRFNLATLRTFFILTVTIALAYGLHKIDPQQTELAQKFSSTLLSKAYQSRLLVWKTGVEAWQKSPLVGTGPETFIISEKALQSLEANNYEYWNIDWPKAHNQLVQILTCTGLIGLIAHLCILIYLAYGLFTSLTSGPETSDQFWRRLFTLFYFFVFLSNLTSFNTVAMQLYTFGILILIGRTHGTVTRSFNLPTRLRFLIGVLGAAPALSLAVAVYDYKQSDILQVAGYDAHQTEQNPSKALNYYFEAMKYHDQEPMLSLQIAFAIARILQDNQVAEKAQAKGQASKVPILTADEKSQAIEKIDHYAAESIHLSEGQYHPYRIAAELNWNIFLSGVVGPERALQSYALLISRYPNNPDNYFKLGTIYFKLNKPELFIGEMEKAISLKEDYLPAYGELLIYYYQLEDVDHVWSLVEKIKSIEFKNPEFIETLKKLAYLAEKNHDDLSARTLWEQYHKYHSIVL